MPWVEASSAPGVATVVGDGKEAVLQVDIAPGRIRLLGPHFDPPLSGVRAARIRYRWLGAGAGDVFWMTLWVREPNPDPSGLVPGLTKTRFDYSPLRTGAWLEDLFEWSLASSPLTLSFPALELGGRNDTPGAGDWHPHGTAEIDWIALVR
jgi:hypothetical protein